MADVIALRLTLHDDVTKTLQGINRQLGQTVKQKRYLSRQLKHVGSDITSVGKTLLPLAGAITAVGALGARSFVDFDYTITSAGAKASATREQVEKLRKTAVKLGADFPISASDAAKGMENLAAAGYNANEIMAAMPSIVTSAVASGEDLALVSSTVSNALNIWNLRQGDVAKNASRVADVVQMAANKSSLALGDFGVAMQFAGAPAASLHVSIEELATAMALMKNNGIEASTIGTSLRATFTRLADPPKEAADVLSQLGVTVKNASGQFVGLESVTGQLRTKMQGLSDTQKVAYAQALAGTNGYSGLLSLINTSPQAYKAMRNSIDSASGSAQKQADIMKNTVKGAILDLQSKLESLAISTVGLFAPAIQKATGSIASFVAWLNSLSDTTKSFITKFAFSIVGFTAMTFVIGKLCLVGASVISVFADVQAVLEGTKASNKLVEYSVKGVTRAYRGLRESAMLSTVITQTKALFLTLKTGGIRGVLPAIARGLLQVARAGMAFVMTPLGLTIMGIALAAYLLYKNWNTVAPYILGVFKQLQTVVLSAWQSIQPALQGLWQALRPVRVALTSLWHVIGGGVSTACKGLLTILGMLVSFLGSVFIGQVKVVFGMMGTLITLVVNVITAQVKALITIFTGIVHFISGVFTGDWKLAWEGVVQVFGGVFGGIKDICMAVLGAVKGMINSLVDGINNIHVAVPSWVPGIGGHEFGPLNIPRLYTGTSNWSGGPAMIHDKGAEIVDLPTGSRVIPHDESLATAYQQGKSEGSQGIVVNIYSPTVSKETDIRDLAHAVATELAYELKKHSMNRRVGAI